MTFSPAEVLLTPQEYATTLARDKRPIASPGRASLVAAVRPTPGAKALYFVARNDRTHVFSETLREHSRAVRKYQR